MSHGHQDGTGTGSGPAVRRPSDGVKHRLPALDGLRAFAIVWVILLHAGYSVSFPGWFKGFADRGVHGVTVFFVLSGFLITWLLLEEEQRRGSFSLSQFYVRRAFRILPPVLLALGGLAILNGRLNLGVTVLDWMGSLFFFRNLLDGSYYTAHFWSLAIEEQFYLVWPIILWWTPARWRLGLTAGLCAFAPVWRQINMEWFGASNLNWSRADLLYDYLLVGALLAQCQRHPRFRRILADGELRAYGVVVAGIAMVALALVVPLPRYLAPARIPLELVGIALTLKVLVEGRARWFQRVLNWGPVETIGRLSYSLYLWQQLFFPKQPVADWQRLPVNLLLVLGAAAASYHLLELPALRWRERFLNRNRKSTPSGSSA